MSLWTDIGAQSGFGAIPKGGGHLDAVERVKDWTRSRFGLSGDDTILLNEVSRALPGFPAVETVVAFWADGTSHRFRVFKPVERVAQDDLPPAFMKDALAFNRFDCECC